MCLCVEGDEGVGEGDVFAHAFVFVALSGV